MTDSWTVTLPCNRAQAEALTGDHPGLAAIVPLPVLVASEVDEDSDRWQIDASVPETFLLKPGESRDVLISFDLPAGAFATVVLQELLGDQMTEGAAPDREASI